MMSLKPAAIWGRYELKAVLGRARVWLAALWRRAQAPATNSGSARPTSSMFCRKAVLAVVSLLSESVRQLSWKSWLNSQGVSMDRFGIFVTGAAILALQLIASRIMAPFFGVSLYIWTGILSITLLCLAFGYYVGGIYSQNKFKERLHTVFYFIPALSSVALLTSALVYPITLGWLARISLMGGTFVASIILLSAPLVAMSALNPILVAIERSATENQGDGGRGVFFVSTIGSVFGASSPPFA